MTFLRSKPPEARLRGDTMATMSSIRLTAYEWHGGGGSPLYSFASTGGKVHSEEHRANLVSEIEGNIRYCDNEASPQWLAEHDKAAEEARLTRLLAHIWQAEVGSQIEDPGEHYE
jgi:hypothetical protein